MDGQNGLGDLKTWYQGSLAEKREALQALLAKGSWSSAEEAELRGLAHKLAGSAATYGFPAVGGAAAVVEEGEPPALRSLMPPLMAALDRALAGYDPAAAARAAREAKHAGRGVSPAGSKAAEGRSAAPRILLAEDDPTVAAIIRQKLEGRGIAVTWHEDGKAALEEALATPFDLFILDVDLPELDGFGLLSRLRDNSATKKSPVMMLTAKKTDKDVRLGLGLGANDYLIKPFMPFEVLKRVEKLLAASRAR